MKKSRKLCFNLLYFVILLLPKTNLSQTFWSEDFGVGCNQGAIANAAVPTATNGTWTVTALAIPGGGNGPQSNEWFISASENGNAVAVCGSGCGNNQTLHISSTTPLDNNATYLQTLDAATGKQAESPTINCTGQTGISLSFNYLTDGIAGQDFCEVVYSVNNGGAWVSLGNLLTTTTTPCLPQGTWASATYTLPTTVDNNPNVKIAFRWINTSVVGGLQAISVAIDEVKLFSTLSIITVSTACSNQSVTATLSGTSAAATSYSWSSNPVGAIITGTTPLGTTATVNFPAAGVYTLQVDGYVGAVNTYSAIQSVTVLAIPTIVVASTPTLQIICTGNTATLNASGATNYTWIAPPTTTLSAGATSSVIVTPPGSTTYTVFGETAGCISSETVSVNVYATLPLTLAASSFTTCAGVPVTFTVSGGSNYTWSPTSSINLPNSAIVIATPTVPTIYTVTGDNGDVCLGTATVSITFGSSVGSVVPSSTAVCNNYNTTLTAVGATNYTWTGTGILAPINQSSISVGSGVYNYTTSGSGICPLIGSISIGTLSDLVINVAQSSFTTCIETNFPLNSFPVFLNPSGASTYVWSAYNSSTMSNSLGAIFVKPPVSTSFTVTGSTSVCSGSTTVDVIVIPQFTISVIPQQPIICVGDSIKLQVSNIGTLATLPIKSYNWIDPFPISIDNPFNATVTIFPTISSNYTVEVVDSYSCVSLPRIVPVVVLPQPVTAVSIPTINGVATNTLCFVGNQTGPEVNLVLTATNVNPIVAGVVPTFTWLPPYQTPFSPILTPSVTTGVTSNVVVSAQQFTPNPWVSQVQTYTVVSGFNGIPGCRRVDTVSVLAVDCRSVTVASVNFTTATENDTICSRSCVTFSNLASTTSGGPQTYEWRFLGGSPATSTLSNPTICYNLPGVFWVTLKVCNPYKQPLGSCATIAKNAFIKVVDAPNTNISPVYPIIGQLRSDTIIRFGQPITLRAFGAKRYQWEFSSDLSSLTSPTVTVQPFKTSFYIVKGFNSEGCSSNDTVRVIVIEDCGEMFVPTAFSPNNDGNNDILFVRGVCLQTLNFMVFNRWGEKVFETTDIEKGWDGTYNGDVLNTGVFVYRLEGKTYDGRGFSAKGNVTLIR